MLPPADTSVNDPVRFIGIVRRFPLRFTVQWRLRSGAAAGRLGVSVVDQRTASTESRLGGMEDG